MSLGLAGPFPQLFNEPWVRVRRLIVKMKLTVKDHYIALLDTYHFIL